MRLSKFISASGYTSRRKADRLIEDGYVIVNNEVCRDFSKNIISTDEVIVENTLISMQTPRLWLFNKPNGYLCTTNDPSGRKTIYDLLPKKLPNLISIGRLDLNSNGLLLLTNNGELSRYYELPINKVVRKYHVDFSGNLIGSQIKSLESGIIIKGISYGSIKSKILKKIRNKFTLELSLQEGKNREIRNISSHFGWKVINLKRIQYGQYFLNKMREGEIKEVKISEKIMSYIEST
tara:strand:+ start:3992 stop:4699 length:708 start_codon:yes stop_codon:yes gene_type:complete